MKPILIAITILILGLIVIPFSLIVLLLVLGESLETKLYKRDLKILRKAEKNPEKYIHRTNTLLEYYYEGPFDASTPEKIEDVKFKLERLIYLMDTRKDLNKITGNTTPPYNQTDYDSAQERGLDLDDWNDYVKFYRLGEQEDWE